MLDIDSGRIKYRDEGGEFTLVQGDSLKLLAEMPDESVDMIFADPPYFLSNGGMTCKSGKMTSVNKGSWDMSHGVEADFQFHLTWLSECQRLLKPHGSMWVSGTRHIIFGVGFAMQHLGYKLLNDITWYKRNPPPNLSCRYFTHSTETIIWASRNDKAKHKFNYQLMKEHNDGKQMKSLWNILPPRKDEKRFGKHPTQKPIELLERIILSSTDEGDLVLDPFSGSGTTGIAAIRNQRRYIGLELEDEYIDLASKRYEAEVEERLVVAGTHVTPATIDNQLSMN